MMQHQYIERYSGRVVTEQLLADRMVRLLYHGVRENNTRFFKLLTSSWSSHILGMVNFDRPVLSRRNLLAEYGIDRSELRDPPEQLDTARKIFERKIRYEECRPMPREADAVVSPADARVVIGSFRETSLLFLKEKFFAFEEMLGNKEGGRLPLAEVIPADRLFAYFPKPAGLISWLDGGAEFLFNTGSSATGRSLEYGLSERYISALGMDRDWMKRLLDSGAVEEIAVMMPDLFLIDGTEVTAVARLKNPLIAAGLLQLIGIKTLDTQVERKGAHGETSHWAKRGDLLFISTDAGELDKVLKLQAAGGKDSLGQSAELRYMLTKLPPQDSTRAFVYLSDPFIRRLVGPETKIPQHRRVRARGELEALAAGSLLYRLDGHENGSMAELLTKHYVSKPLVATDAAPDPGCGAVSGKFGPLPRMNSLLDLGITTASQLESDAYKQYLENYSRYWRRYFDPIALRLDQPDSGTYELSVFILPLIDNSIYNGLRDIIADGKDGASLKVPVIEPEPVATLSMNLSEQTWIETGGEMLEGFMRQVGIDSAILDSLGPDIHVAISDTDPILELGSGELTQAFGSRMDNNEMIAIPAIVSMFTRPTAVCVGLGDPASVRRALDSSVGRKTRISGNEISGSLYKVADRDGWIYRISFFDMISLRLGIEVQDRFLVIRNMPLTTPFRITGVKQADLPGAEICLSPRACRLQLPALFASAAERERSAAFNGITDLQPLLLTGAKSVGEAAEQHKAWFGFRPRHPGGGEWNWDDRTMTSNRYGSPRQPKQPDYRAEDRDFGPLRRVDAAEIGMRFEEDGLRTVARWKLRAAKK
jgi:phosphatidylserine decarboxylase